MKGKFIMKTTIIKTNSVMKNFVKYICAVLLLIGTCASAWGTKSYTFDLSSNTAGNGGAMTYWYSDAECNTHVVKYYSAGNPTVYYNRLSSGSPYTMYYKDATITTAKTFVVCSAGDGNYAYFHGSGYLFFGKQNSYLTLPTFSSEMITNVTVTTSSSVAKDVEVNVYSGANAASTQVTTQKMYDGNSGDNTQDLSFDITNTYQVDELKIAVDNAKNFQIAQIVITTEPRTYTVTYNDNGKDGGGAAPTDASSPYSLNSNVTVLGNSNSMTLTGHTFDGWNTKADGSGVDFAVGATFSITKDTTFYAKWAPNSHTLAVANVDNIVISSTTPSVIEGSSTSVNYGTTVTLSHGDPDDDRQWGGWNVYKTGDASTTVSVNSDNQFTMPDYNVTVSANIYSNYRFSCANLSLTGPTADLVFITSAASKTVRSQEAFHIEGDGLTPGATVTFSFGSTALDAIFKMKKADGTAPTVSDPGGTIDVDVYVYYTPTGTTDGLDQATNLTATVAGAKPKKATLNTKTIIGRHLPANFVIAAKFADNKWYALPANKANGNLTPVPIRVNSESAPTTAYCENTNSFTLYQDNTSNSPKVILGLTNFKNGSGVSYALFGSASGSEVGKSTGTVSGSPGDQYKWTLAQQATSVSGVGDAKYQITVTNNAQPLAIRTYSGSTTWGLHASSGTRVTEMRLLTLQEVQPLSLKVMEWGTDAIVVSYPNGGSASGVQAAIGDASPSSVTMTSLGGDIYKISTISGLQSNPSKPLYIMATESGTSKQAVVTIPLILTTSKTEAQLRESLPGATADIRNATAKYIDVIIRNGGTMTTNSGSGNFANLYIYPGGKAIVSNNMSFDTIYMRGGYSFLDNKATYRYPDLCVKSGTITTSGVKYDLYIDNRYYYTFAMPYDVALTDVHDETGSDDFNVWVKHYNGETRASGTHVSGWEWYGDNKETQHSFFAGIGYEITAKPKVSGRPIAIIRFPVKTGNITSDASREIGVSVSNYGYDAYGSGSLAANNVGWNFVGNPYLTEYKAGTASPGNANDTLMIVAQGYVQHIDPTTGVWDGTYDWQASNKRFITVPYDTQSDYHSEYVATYAIPAFSAFFIQTKDEGTFYMRGTRPQAAGVAPRYMQAQREMPEVHLDVLLRGDNEAVEAKAGLIIHDKYEGGLKDFEDVEQWFVDQNEQKTYTFASGTALAYNLLNEQAAAQVIPMGYIATVAGEHVYSISESNDVSRLARLLLTDYETGLTTDLLVHDYVFTTEAGRFDERFAISAVLKKDEVVTEVAGTSSDSWTKTIGVYRDGNTLTLRGLPEGSSAYVYDMTGKLIASGQHLHNVASFNIAAQGVYNIRVVDGERAVTLRSVLH
jgi:uncharacterized repeat protein (TIGR02543 family)